MVFQPLEELVLLLNNQITCRELQIRQLVTLLHPTFPSPFTVVAHGVEATGKTLTIERILESIETPSAIIRSQECITTRHLLERTIASIEETLKRQNQETDLDKINGRCESISAFMVELQRLLGGRGKFILVFDGIDRQREAAPTLLPALVRLGELIPHLTVLLVVTFLQPHLLHRVGIPHVHFTPYSRAETLSIVSKTPLSIYKPPTSSRPLNAQHNTVDEDSAWLWKRFTAAAWDSLGQSVARDLVSFWEVCSRLWSPFIQPILTGDYEVKEFSKLMVKNRVLFQSEGALVDSIVPITPNVSNIKATKPSNNLPYYPSHLLVASYLASHNPSKYDITLFSKTSLAKRRKRGGGTAHTPHRALKHRKISRKLLGPQSFPLERLFAIFHAILPHKYAGGGADIMSELATLVGLRLVIKSGTAGDILEGGTKWRVNVGWEFVRDVARSVKFEAESYLVV